MVDLHCISGGLHTYVVIGVCKMFEQKNVKKTASILILKNDKIWQIILRGKTFLLQLWQVALQQD